MVNKIDYMDTNQLYATKYIRNSKAITILWAVFTICYFIINIVVFITPEWISDSESQSSGFVGLWQVCESFDLGSCHILWDNLLNYQLFVSKVATILMALSVLASFLTVLVMIFIIFFKSRKIFLICGWFNIVSALSMILSCASFPLSWNSDEFRRVCGPEANKFELGLCEIRWAYPLAIIGCLDGCILSTLAFTLANKYIRFQSDKSYQNSLYKGEINNAYITDVASIAGSRKSLNLQPILVVTPQHQTNTDDSVSQFSINPRFNRHDYQNSGVHPFQL